MEDVRFYLNNVRINPPQNWRGLEIELNFDTDSITEKVNINEWDFVRENVDIIQAWIDTGLTGGVGIFEAIPFRIEVEKNGVTSIVHNGYLDLPDSDELGLDVMKVKSKEFQSIDWFNDKANFSFEFLADKNTLINGLAPVNACISEADCDFVPYIISTIPDYKDAGLMTINIYVMGRSLRQDILDFEEAVGELSVDVLEWGVIVRLVILTIFIALDVLILLQLLEELLFYIIQPIKYHSCMSVKKLIQKGCAYLDLTFDTSGIFTDYQDMYIMPQKLSNPIKDYSIVSGGGFPQNILSGGASLLTGFTAPKPTEQPGFYKGSFADLIRAVKKIFYAKEVINGGVLKLVRVDETISATPFQIPDVENRVHGTNAKDLKSTYIINFETDISDKNTIQEYEGTAIEVVTQPVVVGNQKNVLMKGLERVDIPFALAKRKEDLTAPEKAMEKFLSDHNRLLGELHEHDVDAVNFVNGVIGAINDIIYTASLILGTNDDEIPTVDLMPNFSAINFDTIRLQVMKLENDYTTVPKIFMMEKGSDYTTNKIADSNATMLNADYLYTTYHFANSFTPTTSKPNGNQYIYKNYEKVPFKFEDFLKVRYNNYVQSPTGSQGKIISLKWQEWNQYASAKIAYNEKFTSNLQEIKLIPTGK